MNPLRFLLVVVCSSVVTVAAFSQELAPETEAEQRSLSALRADAFAALQEGDRTRAQRAARQMVQQHGEEPLARRLAGDVLLRSGKPKEAVEQFDAYLKAVPEAFPELWQRGIALYFTEDYRRGVKQFEQHRTVNPNDVENAAWHFLCLAKAESFEKAQRRILPAPGDRRVPMNEVLHMLRTGDTAAVRQRVEEVPESSPLREEAAFYGNFYLGLYADAQGDRKTAAKLLQRAASDAPRHYMGDVARVYAEYLKR